MEDNWENPYEEDGVTLGPEEALLRETERTKACLLYTSPSPRDRG